jgi:hypothetical protein
VVALALTATAATAAVYEAWPATVSVAFHAKVASLEAIWISGRRP